MNNICEVGFMKHSPWIIRSVCVSAAALLSCPLMAAEPGPVAPKVLWVLKLQEHFVAAPVVADGRLFVSGLAAFNSGAIHALAIEPDAKQRVLWTKSPPYLKLPTVSAPAIVDGKLIFGDGMHQTDGAVLHCLLADSGRPVWQLPMPGQLVHLEGSPAVVEGKLYMGGGSAGVFCVDIGRVSLDGKELTLAETQAVLEKQWKVLLEKYELEKKQDPDFAIPPSEDSLPKPAPKLIWNVGRDKWHVDSSVAVSGDRLLAASAYLDNERLGDRALYCLKTTDGSMLWKAPLKYNPWGGPTVAGKLVVLCSSSIRLDPKDLKGAKGEISAHDLETGEVRWRKEIPGGLVSSAAVAGDSVVCTATDGKLRAFSVKTGSPLWTYPAGPMFAGASIAGDTVYAADLLGVVHAVGLTDGQSRWKLNLATDPAVAAPGMIYGTPLVQGGRLYVASCNLEGPDQRRPGAVVCIGEK